MATKTRTTRPTAVEYKTQAVFTQAEVLALLAQLTAVSQPKPKAKAAPKPRPKASHGEGITQADITAYKTLWSKRVALRKELGLDGWKADETSRNAKMKAIVKQMADLRAKGVNQFLVK